MPVFASLHSAWLLGACILWGPLGQCCWRPPFAHLCLPLHLPHHSLGHQSGLLSIGGMFLPPLYLAHRLFFGRYLHSGLSSIPGLPIFLGFLLSPVVHTLNLT